MQEARTLAQTNATRPLRRRLNMSSQSQGLSNVARLVLTVTRFQTLQANRKSVVIHCYIVLIARTDTITTDSLLLSQREVRVLDSRN